MKYTRHRELRFNLGNFEHMITAATVESEFDDEAKLPTIAASMDKILDRMLANDVNDAKESTSLDETESFVYTWDEIRNGR